MNGGAFTPPQVKDAACSCFGSANSARTRFDGSALTDREINSDAVNRTDTGAGRNKLSHVETAALALEYDVAKIDEATRNEAIRK